MSVKIFSLSIRPLITNGPYSTTVHSRPIRRLHFSNNQSEARSKSVLTVRIPLLKCYVKFTNITLIKRAQARVTTKKEATKAKSDYSETESEESPAPVRKLRRSCVTPTSTKGQAVLPPICIICNQQKLYITESGSFK